MVNKVDERERARLKVGKSKITSSSLNQTRGWAVGTGVIHGFTACGTYSPLWRWSGELLRYP